MNYFKLIPFVIIFFFLAACNSETAVPEENAETADEPTQTAVVETVIVVATATTDPVIETEVVTDSSSEETAVSADAPILESAPVTEGNPALTTLIDLNVRKGPGTNYGIVGVLKLGESANIIGKSPNGHWWKIQCPADAGADCWTSAGAQYGTATNATGVAVAAVPAPPPTYTPTATQTTEQHTTPTATVTIDANATATYTPTATKEGDPTYTPTATEENEPTTTPTPTATTEQVKVADFDNDSLQNPATTLFLSPTGTRNFTHSNAVSYANGDQDDWVEFEFPNNSNSNQNVWVTLECTIIGNPEAQLRAIVYEDGNATNKIVICNQGETTLTVDNTKVQQVQIHWGIPKDNVYADYVLTVVGYR